MLLVHGIACLISLGFASFFVVDLASTTDIFDMENQELPETLWVFFVLGNIAMSAFFLACLGSCCVHTILYMRWMGLTSFLAMLINAWAIVYIVLPWFGKTGWGDQLGATIGMVSSIFHSLFLRYCIYSKLKETRTTRSEEEEYP